MPTTEKVLKDYQMSEDRRQKRTTKELVKLVDALIRNKNKCNKTSYNMTNTICNKEIQIIGLWISI